VQILLIEDDQDLAANIADYLSVRHVEVSHTGNGLSGLHLASTTRPDVIILDIGLPGIDGLTLCEKLRNEAHIDIPVLMLTARDTVEMKVEGLQRGADDYLVKPFSLAELHARLVALVRRDQRKHTTQIVVEDLYLDTKNRTATRDGQQLSLSKLEFDLLVTLCLASPDIVDKEILARTVWGEDYVEPDTIRAHIYQLRKIVDRPYNAPLIQTIRGVGHAVRKQGNG